VNVTMRGAPPRLLVSGEETTIPITITNTGLRTWDPARVHASYHWLWLVPREIASRSRWNIPYQEGIRTELGTAVAPGGNVKLQSRLLAPTIPGLYWLQWDMVDEGSAWFAQVAPRQPRTLVVVAPPLVWVLAPIPLLIAIAGSVRLKPDTTSTLAPPHVVSGFSRTRQLVMSGFSRTRQVVVSGFSRTFEFGPTADIVWCAAVLAIKPLIVVRDALLEPTAVAYWLTVAIAVALPAAAAALLPRRVRVWALFAVGVVASAILLADDVYYRFFGDMASAPALLGARQTGRVWGSIRSLLTPGLLWLVADWPFAAWMATRLTRRRGEERPFAARVVAPATAVGVVAAVGLFLGAPRVLATTPLDQMFRNRAVAEQLGTFGYHAYDAWTYVRARWFRPAVSPQAIDDAVAWFAARAPLRGRASSPFFGAAAGRNLIVVQVESLQDFVVDLDVGGEPVMPHLRGWIDEAVRFTRVSDQTSEGRTSDAELTTMASLLPLDHGAAAFRYPANHYVALPRILRDRGYATLSAVPFEAGFWNRRVMHPIYGFERSLFEPDFQLTEQIGWGLNDRDFLQQMVPRLERLRQPFAAWMITLSLHHPFDDFPAAHKTLRLGALENTSFGNYLHTMRFFDDALEAFKEALARDHLLDSSVVVVFGDHDAGFARTPAVAAAMHIGSSAAAWLMNDRIPWFVRVPGAPGLAGASPTPAGQTDFAPTLLSLLGVDAGPLPYVGRNLLGAPDDPPIVRPYGEWIDAHHLSFTRGSERVCYAAPDRPVEVSAADCEPAAAAARAAHDVSRLVVTEDLQQRIFERLRGESSRTAAR
jgi:lipoteichoic acid synthase